MFYEVLWWQTWAETTASAFTFWLQLIMKCTEWTRCGEIFLHRRALLTSGLTYQVMVTRTDNLESVINLARMVCGFSLRKSIIQQLNIKITPVVCTMFREHKNTPQRKNTSEKCFYNLDFMAEFACWGTRGQTLMQDESSASLAFFCSLHHHSPGHVTCF